MKGSENVLIGDERPSTPTTESVLLVQLHIRTILRFAQSYNSEIGLHNTKDIAAHLENPEGKRQLLWRSLFEARTQFLILPI